MIKKYNNLSFAWGIPGIFIKFGSIIFLEYDILLLYVIGYISGTALLIVGLSYYAKAKGHHPAYGLFGLLSLIGLIILACSTDKILDNEDVEQIKEKVTVGKCICYGCLVPILTFLVLLLLVLIFD